MAGCCSTDYRRMFSRSFAERDARRFRAHGVTGSARTLVELSGDVGDATVLDIGGGVGAIGLELLAAGAARATTVEISSAYEEAATRLAVERGAVDRIDRRVGDIVDDRDAVGPHDIVVMHRVVCCYPDAPGLLNTAANHAQRTLAITFPRDRWWIRLGFAGMNAWMRLRGSAFRGYVHPRALLLQAAQQAGFDETRSHEGRLWASLILQRRDTGRDGSRADA